jgi:signal peptidase
MNSDKKRLLILVLSLLISSIITLFIPSPYSGLVLSIFLITFVILFIFLVKKKKVFSVYKREVLFIFIGAGLVYLTIYYLTGIKFLFYDVNPINLLYEGLPLLIAVVCVEILRTIILSQEYKPTSIICFFAFVMVDISLATKVLEINSFNVFMDLIGLTLLPSIMGNVLYHSTTKDYGLYPNLAYRAILALPSLVIPIVPGTPDSIISLINLIYPLILLGLISLLYKKKDKVAVKKKNKVVAPIVLGVVIALALSFTLLISNQFKIGALVIATESMTGELNKGDFVIFEKIDQNDELEKGNIIVFEKNKNYIVHRIVEIENIDNEERYYTKGDANENMDEGYIVRSEIVGITHFKISYLGYPTLWLRDLFD